MANDEYHAAILKIVNEVDQLVTNNPAVREVFTGHIDRLCKLAEDYGQAQQPYSKQLEKAKKRIEKFTPKQVEKYKLSDGTEAVSLVDICPPPKGYVKMSQYDNPCINVPQCTIYRPAKPANPLLWFGVFGSASIHRKPTEDEKLMCDYVLMAVIHDYELRYSGTPTDSYICSDDYKGKWFERDEFSEQIWAYYHYLNQEITLRYCSATAQERRSQLERALDHVKANIEKQSAGTEQEKGQVKMTNTSLADDLNRIANSVHILGQEESNKKCFQKHIAAFRKAMNTFTQALKEAKEAAIADPDLRHDKELPKPPKEGYEFECLYVLDDHPKGFWRPPLPFNPEGYLQRFQRKLFGFFTREDKPRNQKQKLMCEFALIAAIRDKGLDIPACDRLTDTEKDDWVDSLWSLLDIEGSTLDDYNTLPDRMRNINTAYVDVLANLPAGKRQETNGDDARDDESFEGVLSKPMPKSRMMSALNIDSYETFNSFADRHGIKKINRKTYQIRLDKMDARTREKLEKA